jgi:hypothetical protein
MHANPAWFPAWAHGHAARQELSRRVRSRTDYMQFVQLFTPAYLAGWVHKEVAKRLEAFVEAVELGLSPRLMIFMPPQRRQVRAGLAAVSAVDPGPAPGLGSRLRDV